MDFGVGLGLGVVVNVSLAIVLWRTVGSYGLVGLGVWCVLAGIASAFLYPNDHWLLAFVYGFVAWPWMLVSVILILLLLGSGRY